MNVYVLTFFLINFFSCSDAAFLTGSDGAAKKPSDDNGVPVIVDDKKEPTGFGDGDEVNKPDPNRLFDSSGSDELVTFAMVVNDFKCGMCHTTVRGTILSITEVHPIWANSNMIVEGDWYVSGVMNAGAGSGVSVTTKGILEQNYSGGKLPKDRDGDGKPDFPKFDPDEIEEKMFGRVVSKDKSISKVHRGNIVLVGTDSDPIELNGEVLVKGDLVIKGRYRGVGNIYVTGRIYIPADLTAMKSPFPYSDDPVEARKQGEEAVKKDYDALGLASKNSVIINDFENRSATNGGGSVFEHSETPVQFRAAAIGVRDIYDWYPGGKAGYESLFEPSVRSCSEPRNFNTTHSFSQVDAYLYSENVIGGRAGRNSYAINGGVMTDHFHIISAARHCPDAAHPVHGYAWNRNHINFDWRMVNGLQILKQLGPYFSK